MKCKLYINPGMYCKSHEFKSLSELRDYSKVPNEYTASAINLAHSSTTFEYNSEQYNNKICINIC